MHNSWDCENFHSLAMAESQGPDVQKILGKNTKFSVSFS